MSTDRELLELAAKAAGMRIDFDDAMDCGEDTIRYFDCENGGFWNALTDDGDALRLAVKLAINVVPNYHAEWHTGIGETFKAGREFTTEADGDPYTATRRAIVRAAAEIGRTL